MPGIMGGAGPSGMSSGATQQRQVAQDDPKYIRDMLLANPHELALLKERNPPLAEALQSGDLGQYHFQHLVDALQTEVVTHMSIVF